MLRRFIPHRGARGEVLNSALQGVALHPFLGAVGQSARRRARLTHVRVHALKQTLGRRLRAAGVSFEDRQDLLGHRSGRITTHDSAAELEHLLTAANRVCESNARKMSPAMLKRKTPTAVAAGA